MDFLLNGQASGNVAGVLMQHNFDPAALRPWIGADGRTYIATTNAQGQLVATPVQNATATLRLDEWKALDRAIIKVAKPRLRVFGDLRSRGLVYSVPNAMGKTVLESERMTDISAATVSMDGMRRSETDRPEFDLVGLPLPIIHKDFQYSLRQISASRNGGSPLDTTTAEMAARKVVEEVEALTLGTASTYAYGGYTIYGYRNFPQRLTKSLTTPDGTNQATTVREVLDMRSLSQAAHYYGPWVLYTSPNWDKWLDEDYSASKGDNTLRERLAKIAGIEDIRTADNLPAYDMVLVQQSSDVVRAVVGMDVTTVQWETQGGMLQHFKVMCILVPQLRCDANDQTGIVHGSV